MTQTPGPKSLPLFAITSLVTILIALSGCGSSKTSSTSPSSPSSPSPASAGSFSVASVMPASGAIGVATNTTVTITFSGAADSSTVNTTNITLTGASAVTGAVTYDSSNNTATFTPAAALAASTTYTVVVSGVTSSSGAALASAFKSTFTTAASGASSNIQYQSELFNPETLAMNGQVTVDTSGNVTVQLTGGLASTSFAVTFCPAWDAALYPASPLACMTIGTLATNASGSGSLTAMFPQSGNWAGDFELRTTGSTTGYNTWLTVESAATETYSAVLLPLTTTNEGQDTNVTPQDPLTSGSVTFSNGMVQFAMNGASAGTIWDSNVSENYYIDSSGTYVISQFSTSASGSASSSGTLPTNGDIFQVVPGITSGGEQEPGAGFIGGFKVP